MYPPYNPAQVHRGLFNLPRRRMPPQQLQPQILLPLKRPLSHLSRLLTFLRRIQASRPNLMLKILPSMSSPVKVPTQSPPATSLPSRCPILRRHPVPIDLMRLVLTLQSP